MDTNIGTTPYGPPGAPGVDPVLYYRLTVDFLSAGNNWAAAFTDDANIGMDIYLSGTKGADGTDGQDGQEDRWSGQDGLMVIKVLTEIQLNGLFNMIIIFQ